MVRSEHSSRWIRQKGTRRVSQKMFYHDGLSKAERVDLERAAEVENLDEEIAVLRVRLKTALKERPEDTRCWYAGSGC